MGFSSFSAPAPNEGFIALTLATICYLVYTPLCGFTVCRLFKRRNKVAYTRSLALQWVLITAVLLLDWTQCSITKWGEGGRGDQLPNLYWPSGGSVTAVCVSCGHGIIMDREKISLTAWDDALSVLVLIMADGLLMYRFSAMWTKSKWSSVLLGGWIGSMTAFTCMKLYSSPETTTPVLQRHAYVLVLLYASLIISILNAAFSVTRTTFLPGGNPSLSAPVPDQRLYQILIDSGCIYGIGLFISAISLTNALTNKGAPFRYYAQTIPYYYGGPVLTLIAGIAPTLVALRVVMQMPHIEVDGTRRLSRAGSPKSRLRSQVVIHAGAV